MKKLLQQNKRTRPSVVRPRPKPENKSTTAVAVVENDTNRWGVVLRESERILADAPQPGDFLSISSTPPAFWHGKSESYHERIEGVITDARFEYKNWKDKDEQGRPSIEPYDPETPMGEPWELSATVTIETDHTRYFLNLARWNVINRLTPYFTDLGNRGLDFTQVITSFRVKKMTWEDRTWGALILRPLNKN